ncbi:MAG: ABC transporter permease, partial [Pantoea sp.]|nr:ABC transporter permease [Pantoea sp.]
LWTSVGISALAAIVGTLLLFLLTFGIRRQPGRTADFATLLSALPVGVPGLVLGLAYVFTFNSADLPWGMLYGTALLVALCNYYHYHTQGFTSQAAAFSTCIMGIVAIMALLLNLLTGKRR